VKEAQKMISDLMSSIHIKLRSIMNIREFPNDICHTIEMINYDLKELSLSLENMQAELNDAYVRIIALEKKLKQKEDNT